MAAEDLLQMSAMLKAQLPFLFSFAFMRWLLGIVLGGVGGWAVRRLGCGHRMPALVGALAGARALVSVLALASLSGAWLQQSVLHETPRLCGPHVSARVQGVAAATAVLILFTSGQSLSLGMALACLKAVADTSASSTMLAGIAVLFAVRRGPACVSATSAALASFVCGCWHEQHGTGGATLALLVITMHISALAASCAARSGISGTRALLRVPARVWANVAGRKRCPRLRQ